MSLVAISAETAAQDGTHDADCPVTTEIAATLDDVETLWRAFEADAIASPYQRFDWVRAHATAMTVGRISVAIVRDAAGRPLMMLPLVVSRRHGLRIAEAVGGKHSNYNLPLMRPVFARSLGAAQARAVLRDIARQMGADAVSIPHAPVEWHDERNPFALGRPSPSNAYRVRLDPDADATLARVCSSHARKKLRNKENGLRKLGEVAVLEARTEADAEIILGEFLRQKRARFLELGITDPFIATEAQAFLRQGSLQGLAQGRPGIELYALTLEGAVIAVLGGAADRERLSGMFISFENAQELARYSPGDLLVSHVIRRQCERGRRVFDLGVGEARYKRTFCDEVDRLVDVVLPVTPAGHLYAAVTGLAHDAKRHIKASPRAMRLIALARRLKSASAPSN